MESILPDSRSALFHELSARTFTWLPEKGVGFYPVEAGTEPYDQAYFERYREQAATELGHKLMGARCAFVARHTRGHVVDVGIGSGAFVTCRNKAWRLRTTGYDVNPAGLDWLHARNLFSDPYRFATHAITLWDVLEHMPDFRPLLENVASYVFVSVPIFGGPTDALRSKHFRRDEHVWYFTARGLRDIFDSCGFGCVEDSFFESDLGRESIMSFAFKRRAA